MFKAVYRFVVFVQSLNLKVALIETVLPEQQPGVGIEQRAFASGIVPVNVKVVAVGLEVELPDALEIAKFQVKQFQPWALGSLFVVKERICHSRPPRSVSRSYAIESVSFAYTST